MLAGLLYLHHHPHYVLAKWPPNGDHIYLVQSPTLRWFDLILLHSLEKKLIINLHQQGIISIDLKTDGWHTGIPYTTPGPKSVLPIFLRDTRVEVWGDPEAAFREAHGFNEAEEPKRVASWGDLKTWLFSVNKQICIIFLYIYIYHD